jgi:murein DD-endopeptidase MepM/ murein hydrolase activator NlpD
MTDLKTDESRPARDMSAFRLKARNILYLAGLRLHIWRFHAVNFILRNRITAAKATAAFGAFAAFLFLLTSVLHVPQFVKKTLKQQFGIGGPPILRVDHYRIQPQESLWGIAKRNNLQFDTLITVNKLRNIHSLRVGQEIIIPNQDGILYRVRKSEDVFSIAKKFAVKVEDLLDVNDLTVSELNGVHTNLEIFVPGAKLSAEDRLSLLGLSFIQPAGGRIRSGFGWRLDPVTRNQRGFHTGIDFACGPGTLVRAAADGQVIYSGSKGGYGLVVILRHPRGYTTIYAHLSQSLVRQGQFVKAGQYVAKSGNSGRSTGPHLHFEVRKYGVPTNPVGSLQVFAAGR